MQNLQVTQLKKEDGELKTNDEETADELCRSLKDFFQLAPNHHVP